ncbi:uncharacterized protein TNCV_1386851 [Trichonephila clavipes]|nr:uncharacterized protein TNCV_1386851 [Trichonephila clavipes]
MEIRTGSSDNSSLCDESSGFDKVQRRSNESRDGKKKGTEKEKPNREKTVTPTRSGYNLRPRDGKGVESRPAMEMKTQQGGPVQTRKSNGRSYNPYIEERTRSDNRNARRRGGQQRKDQERRIAEREERLRFEQLRLDEQKRKYEFELEKLRIQTQSKLGADTSKESDTKFLVKEVSKFIHRFDLKENISLYLKLFERQAQRLNINQENWVSHLLGLLPTEVSHIIAREPDDKANSYEHVRDLLLERFKLTPEKFRQLFATHQKAPERTWIDFYHQLKRKTPFEFKEYYLDEWANMNSPVQLAEKLEEFEDFKRTLKQKSSSPFVKKQEFKPTEKNRRYEAPGKF